MLIDNGQLTMDNELAVVDSDGMATFVCACCKAVVALEELCHSDALDEDYCFDCYCEIEEN